MGRGGAIGNCGQAPTGPAPQGTIVVNKFGRNPDVDTTSDPEDVWGGGGLYVFMTGPTSLEALSSDANDDKDAGTGARSININGLDGDTGLEKDVVVEIDGVTPVAIPGTWRAINRAYVVTVGSAGSNLGVLTIRAQGAGQTYATIQIDEGQTAAAIYTVPADKKGKLFRHWATFDKGAVSGSATLHVMVRYNGEAWRNRQAFTITNSAQWDFLYHAGGIDLLPLTDIRMEVVEVSTNDIGIDAGFDLYLMDA